MSSFFALVDCRSQTRSTAFSSLSVLFSFSLLDFFNSIPDKRALMLVIRSMQGTSLPQTTSMPGPCCAAERRKRNLGWEHRVCRDAKQATRYCRSFRRGIRIPLEGCTFRKGKQRIEHEYLFIQCSNGYLETRLQGGVSRCSMMTSKLVGSKPAI